MLTIYINGLIIFGFIFLIVLFAAGFWSMLEEDTEPVMMIFAVGSIAVLVWPVAVAVAAVALPVSIGYAFIKGWVLVVKNVQRSL